MKIWVADGTRGLMRQSGGEWRRVGPPGNTVCPWGRQIYCSGQTRCVCLDQESGAERFDFPVPTGVCALAPLGRMICALSADADSLSAFCPHTGELLFSSPAGSYPRDLCVSPCGRYVAVAGGAAGEILLFDETLSCIQRRRVPGVACAVCFLPRALAALCAVGDGELSSRLLLISPRGVAEEAFACPDAPCALCALPGGQCLMGCHGTIFCFRADGKLFYRRPCAYPARIRPWQSSALICDAWQGVVKRLGGPVVYEGVEPLDVVVT